MDWTPLVKLLGLVIWLGMPAAAGWIAHRKGNSWIPIVILAMVVPPIGVAVASFQSARPGTNPQASTRAKLVFGLLPLWASLVWMAAGYFASESSHYWQGAPWLVVMALSACALTLILVELFPRR